MNTWKKLMTYIPGLLMAFETNTRSHDYQTNYPHWHYDHHWPKVQQRHMNSYSNPPTMVQNC